MANTVSAKTLSVTDIITAGAFKTAHSDVAPGSGQSGIFHFPFRIHAREELCAHEGKGPDYHYRVYAPFLVRRTGSPLTDDVPRQLWPNFRWHDLAPPEMRQWMAAPDLHYATDGKKAIWYDGLRIDIWGPDATKRVSPFVLSAMRWLRNLSGQPWISDVDRHYASTMKRAFPIDDSGVAINEAIGLTQVRLARFSFVTNAMWKASFEHAVRFEVPISSNLYFDAMNAAAIDDYPRAIMNLAMSLESSRDLNFSKVHPAEFLEGRGPKLKAPFNSTDLLKHLSVHSEQAFHRNFSKEHPKYWPHLQNLYKARQHVAHGKGPVFPSTNSFKVVDRHSFLAMQISALVALRWMEELVNTVLKTTRTK